MKIDDGFHITAAQRSELSAVLELYSHLHASDAPLPPEAELHRVWDEIIDDPRLHLLFGKLGGNIVASCSLVIVPNLTRGARPYGLIENVVTHSDHRGKGFGSRVLREAQRIAWDRGCYKVMLMTGSKREETLGFYERAGFVRGLKTGFVAKPDSQRPISE